MFTAAFALQLLVKSTVLLGVAHILAYALRNQWARSRMLLWRSTAAAVLMLPVLSLVSARLTTMQLHVLPGLTFAAGTTTAQNGTAQIDFVLWMWSLWALIGTLLLLRVATAHWLIWRAVRKDVGTSGSAVVKCRQISGPVAWGVFRPRVLLPADSDTWDAERRDIVIAHESTHIDSNDCLWQFIAQVAASVYWFHPLAWRVLAHLREETEFHCDEVLLALGYRPSAYAETLLAFANTTSRFERLCPVTVAVARRTTVGRRIQRILTMDSRHRFTRMGAVVAVLAFALVFPIAAMQAGKSSDKIYKVAGDIKPPVPIYKEQPRYTPEAKEAKIQGSVTLEVVINTEGHVANVDVLNGLDAGLDRNAVEAVKTWTFQPATKDGKAVNVKARIEINFKLV